MALAWPKTSQSRAIRTQIWPKPLQIWSTSAHIWSNTLQPWPRRAQICARNQIRFGQQRDQTSCARTRPPSTEIVLAWTKLAPTSTKLGPSSTKQSWPQIRPTRARVWPESARTRPHRSLGPRSGCSCDFDGTVKADACSLGPIRPKERDAGWSVSFRPRTSPHLASHEPTSHQESAEVGPHIVPDPADVGPESDQHRQS